eukprot:3096884-Prymnesium_polylepis.1
MAKKVRAWVLGRSRNLKKMPHASRVLFFKRALLTVERQRGQAWMGPGRDATTVKSLGSVRRSSKD